MPTREEIEAWLLGKRPSPPGVPDPPKHPIVLGPHHIGFPFVTPVGNVIVEVRTEDESVGVMLPLPWEIPRECVAIWDYVLRMNTVFNMVRFILTEGGGLTLVAGHSTGDPRNPDYFWETGVHALFAGVFTVALQICGDVLRLLAECERQREGF